MVNVIRTPVRPWLEATSGGAMLAGWAVLGSLAYGLAAQDVLHWWKLVLGALMVLGAWTFILRQD